MVHFGVFNTCTWHKYGCINLSALAVPLVDDGAGAARSAGSRTSPSLATAWKDISLML